MANELCTSLRLIDKDLSGKLLQIVEEHGTSASFVVGSLMWNASRTNTSILLLALHNSLAHHHNVTKKLGFNLKGAIDNKSAVVFEPVAAFCEKFVKSGEMANGNFDVIDHFLGGEMTTMFEDVKNTLSLMSGKKCLVIDDLGILMNMGIGLAHVITFLQCCRKLQESDKDISLIVSSHVTENCEDHRLLADFISHIADLRVTVSPLRTGFSTNVTGTMEVVDNLERAFGTTSEKRVYHFKLTDRQIKVFAPGTVGIYG